MTSQFWVKISKACEGSLVSVGCEQELSLSAAATSVVKAGQHRVVGSMPSVSRLSLAAEA